MLLMFRRGRKVILKAVVLATIALNAIFSFSVGDCATPIKSDLNQEQSRNYNYHNQSVCRIIDIVFPDMGVLKKTSWAMLLLGTIAVETHFLDRYSGKSSNGNGPYQIIGETAYGIIHRYVEYPIKGSQKRGRREKLIPLFAKVTEGRLTWDRLVRMNRDELRQLCVDDYDFAGLISLLIYKEIFERKGIGLVSSSPDDLASLWKRYYNTSLGVGTEKRFIQRFMSVHAYFA